MLDLSIGQTIDASAFVYYNHIVNENGKSISFKRHKFLIDFYQDQSREIVAKKCSQVGFSTAAIIKALHLAKYKKANTIYLLPSKSIVKDFVLPKVDPLINSNKPLKDMMGKTDNLGLKSVGIGRDQRFVYFRSSWDESSGIAISAHILIADELDRSNQKAISTYKTRLDAALLDRPDLGWDWRFSNPSIEGFGVDELYKKSDMKRWFIKCSRCNHYQVLTFPDNINFKEKCYICMRCKRPLSDDDRTRGQWVKAYLGRSISGYWISQLMAPWIPASKIIEDSLGDQSIFYNFTLGLPYTSKDIQMTREALTKCIQPDYNPRTDVAIGVDNGIIKHFVVGNRYGIFQVGSTESWQEIENLRNQYDAYMVIDSNPYPTPVMKLVNKYPGKVFAHFYSDDTKQMGTIRFGEGDDAGIVKSDRTKLIDAVVADINSQDILFNLTLTDLENQEYIKHWLNIYRIIEETSKGIKHGVWKTIEGKPDHFAHATSYFKVAMQQTLTRGSVIVTPTAKQKSQEKSIYINPDNSIIDGFSLEKLKEGLNRPKGKNWTTR
ncbi:MAG: phage terminase large subunit family protein [Candidatus Paceibacterota bacterium]|jgi:hypothetical protein